MTGPTDINPHIVEALYNEALTLADDVRGSFDLSGRLEEAGQDEDIARVALSCEALRTTTRMMHIIAWLLNQRAFFAGEITQLQLRRHGRLPSRASRSDPAQTALLSPELRGIVTTTERLYARIERLDAAWQDNFRMQPCAVDRLRERIGQRLKAI
ncbi:MAG: AraC family transcriptional regulator [Sphingomonadales bacterium 63-6]|nr:MAG: AraC family transcriptional regulator [Sphingomonadales bacterium 63-6]